MLKEKRKELGITQAELASKAGVNRSQIAKLESGEIKAENLTVKTLFAIADVLNVDPRELIEKEG